MNKILEAGRATLARAYPRLSQREDYYRGRIQRVRLGFAQAFGNGETRLFSAPGRTEIGGNHTDHQRGHVLAAAIDLDVLGAAAPNADRVIRVQSEGFPLNVVELDDLSPRPGERNNSNALIRGIAARLTALGHTVEGFDLYTTSDVLKGSGLSSSAAFEVLVGAVANGLYCGGEVSQVELAQIGQYAENEYFGKPCGLMDQTASAVGSAVAIDFADTARPAIERLDFDFAASGHSLCIIDSGADHTELTGEYAAIPREMGQVAAYLGREVLGQLTKEALLADFSGVRAAAGDRAALRALHFFEDDARAVQEARQLREGDFDGFLQTVRASGRSSWMYLQNVSVTGAVKEQEVACVLALCDSLLGERGAFRVHGGGFAGTVQAFVPNDMLDFFVNQMRRLAGPDSCHVLSIRPAGGVELEEV